MQYKKIYKIDLEKHGMWLKASEKTGEEETDESFFF